MEPVIAAARVVVLDHTAALGGAELALVRLLAELDRDRFQVQVVLFSDGPLREQITRIGVPVTVLPLDSRVAGRARGGLLTSPLTSIQDAFRTVAFAARLARLLRATKSDLVVANSLKSALVCAAAAPIAGKPWIWHLHDRLADDYLPPPLARVLRLLARSAPRGLVANSQATLASVGAISSHRSMVAYPGLPATAFGKTAEPVGRPTVGLIGRIGPTKGQREFLESAAAVARTHPDARFRIIGSAMFNDTPYEQEIRALPTELGIADKVEFTGWSDDPREELKRLHLVVHASPVPEPFGQVVIEAMAAGVPVIATRAGGVTEILDPDGISGTEAVTLTAYGILVLAGDAPALASAVRWVLDHPESSRPMVENAYTSAAERFTIARTAASVTQAWSRALLGRRRWRPGSR